jgi:hypothetical protein
VVPVESPITNARKQMSLVLDPYSLTSIDLLLDAGTKMHSLLESNLHSSMRIEKRNVMTREPFNGQTIWIKTF